jgi:hypothetical protein
MMVFPGKLPVAKMLKGGGLVVITVNLISRSCEGSELMPFLKS